VDAPPILVASSHTIDFLAHRAVEWVIISLIHFD
jgi:hypothetical protein